MDKRQRRIREGSQRTTRTFSFFCRQKIGFSVAIFWYQIFQNPPSSAQNLSLSAYRHFTGFVVTRIIQEKKASRLFFKGFYLRRAW